ncbi:hypothetical protein [Streptomyces coriariae]|nr:hypothetical protein [Streptomyces coriariae]
MTCTNKVTGRPTTGFMAFDEANGLSFGQATAARQAFLRKPLPK